MKELHCEECNDIDGKHEARCNHARFEPQLCILKPDFPAGTKVSYVYDKYVVSERIPRHGIVVAIDPELWENTRALGRSKGMQPVLYGGERVPVWTPKRSLKLQA